MPMELRKFISGSMVKCTGSSIRLTLPSDPSPREIWIRSENGTVYFEINSTTGSASGSSSGYIPQDFLDMSPELYNLNTLDVFGSSGVNAHIRYFTF